MKDCVRKIELMHKTFGKCEGHICGECSNLEIVRVSDRVLRKCDVYGHTASEASDWASKYLACGMFNKTWKGNKIIRLISRGPKIEEKQIEGQESFFEDESEERG